MYDPHPVEMLVEDIFSAVANLTLIGLLLWAAFKFLLLLTEGESPEEETKNSFFIFVIVAVVGFILMFNEKTVLFLLIENFENAVLLIGMLAMENLILEAASAGDEDFFPATITIVALLFFSGLLPFFILTIIIKYLLYLLYFIIKSLLELLYSFFSFLTEKIRDIIDGRYDEKEE